MKPEKAMEPSGRELPGFRKKSFALPYRGGMIWFEHLDGLGRFCQGGRTVKSAGSFPDGGPLSAWPSALNRMWEKPRNG